MSAEAARTVLPAEIVSELEQRGGSSALDGFLNEHTDIVTSSTVEQLSDLVRHRLRVNVDQALRLAEAALAIAGKLSDHGSLGRGFRAKANALWFKGDCKAAVALFDTAVDHFDSAQLAEEIGRTLSSSIQALGLLGEYNRAFAAAERARRIFSDLGDGWRTARLELNVANLYHRQDRFAEALGLYQRAYEELLPHKDAEGLGVALHNLAVCLIMLNDFERALSCYDRVRTLCDRNDMPLLAVQADYNIAYLYFLRGDYDAAIASLNRTRQRSREHGDAYHTALCDLDQAEIYLELNLTREALRMASEAKRQFEELGMGFEKGRSTANLGIAFHRSMENARAVELFAEARTIFEKEKNKAWQSLISLYHAIVLCELRRYEESKQLCLLARTFFAAMGLDRRKTLCDLLLARVSLESGDASECRRLCADVLPRLDALQAPLIGFQTHLLLGYAEWAAGDPTAAFSSLNSARSELETLRGNLQGEELKIAFLNDKSAVYQGLVELCITHELDSAEAVFSYVEQAKSRILAEIMFGRSGRVVWDQADGIAVGRLRTLKGELNWLYHRIEQEQMAEGTISVQRIERLRDEARSREEEFLRLVRELEGVAGHTPSLQSEAPVDLARIRTSLGKDAAIVEYFQTRTDFIAVVLDSSNIHVVRLEPAGQITSHIQMLEFQLSKFHLRSSYAETFQNELLAATHNRLQALHHALIAPLGPYLKRKHLVVVPHGILHYVPFHALFDGKEYLIDRFTVSYAPSASIYSMCHGKRANTQGPSQLMGIQDDNAPLIKSEIESVATVVPESKVWLGAAATTDILRTLGPESRMIHVATHGVFRRDNPIFSSVRLADSYLTLHDFYQLNLPVDLLTLSGCGTGLSVVAAGDELLGLIRGVLGAGARSLLLSLWDVHDGTTSEFMTRFYRNLENRHDKAGALQAAMLETRERQPHPYFWASFMLVGKAFN